MSVFQTPGVGTPFANATSGSVIFVDASGLHGEDNASGGAFKWDTSIKQLLVRSGSAGTAPAWTTGVDVMVVEAPLAGNGVLQFFTANNKVGGLGFSDTDARNQGVLSYDHSTDKFGINAAGVANVITISGTQLAMNVAGSGFAIKEGTNCCAGVATLVAGTVTVSTTKVTANSRISLSGQNSSGTHGELTVTSRTAGTQFVIGSSNGADTRLVYWEIKEPA